MTGKTHQVIGLTCGLAVFLATAPAGYAPATLAAVLIVSSLGALLPDIDSPAAKIWGYVPLGRVVGEIVDPMLDHRNITHSLLGFSAFAYGFSLLLSHMPSYWGIDSGAVWLSFAVALASHLVADMVTVEGIPLLYPYGRSFGIPPHPFAGLRILTGQWFENLIVFPAFNLLLALLVWSNYGALHGLLFK